MFEENEWLRESDQEIEINEMIENLLSSGNVFEDEQDAREAAIDAINENRYYERMR